MQCTAVYLIFSANPPVTASSLARGIIGARNIRLFCDVSSCCAVNPHSTEGSLENGETQGLSRLRRTPETHDALAP